MITIAYTFLALRICTFNFYCKILPIPDYWEKKHTKTPPPLPPKSVLKDSFFIYIMINYPPMNEVQEGI